MSRIGKLFTVVLVGLTISGSAAAVGVGGSIATSRHNLSNLNTIANPDPFGNPPPPNMEGWSFQDFNQICIYCHTPHNANTAYDAGQRLWNRQSYTATYTPYDSPTLSNTPHMPGGVTLLCLSCHDGTIAVDAIKSSALVPINPPQGGLGGRKMSNAGGSDTCSRGCHTGDHSRRYLGTNLSDDHPVSIIYSVALNDPQKAGQFAPVVGDKIGPLKLFSGKVECASCHDVHTPSDPFVKTDPNGYSTVRSFHLRTANSSSALCMTCHLK